MVILWAVIKGLTIKSFFGEEDPRCRLLIGPTNLKENLRFVVANISGLASLQIKDYQYIGRPYLQ
jgi:hypothetical protein